MQKHVNKHIVFPWKMNDLELSLMATAAATFNARVYRRKSYTFQPNFHRWVVGARLRDMRNSKRSEKKGEKKTLRSEIIQFSLIFSAKMIH